MKPVLIAFLATTIATSTLAQGTITFLTSITKNPIFYSSDGSISGVQLLGTDGQAGPWGTVNYEIYTAPNGTPLPENPFDLVYGDPFSLWTGTAVGPVTYTSPGAIEAISMTLPASSGAPGASVEMEIVAYTGSLQSPTLYDFSGEHFFGGTTITYNGITTSTGAYGWSQPTGNLGTTPPGLPVPVVFGSTGLGSIVLVVIPEPSAIALGSLGAAALMLFRRRS